MRNQPTPKTLREQERERIRSGDQPMTGDAALGQAHCPECDGGECAHCDYTGSRAVYLRKAKG